MRTWRVFWGFYTVQAHPAEQGSPPQARAGLARPTNAKDGCRQRMTPCSVLQAKAQWLVSSPQFSHEHQLVKPTKDLLTLKRSEAEMGPNSTGVPSPTGPHFPSCSHGGAGHPAQPLTLLRASWRGRGVTSCLRDVRLGSRVLLVKLLPFALSTSLFTGAGTSMHCQAPKAWGCGPTLTVSSQMNN